MSKLSFDEHISQHNRFTNSDNDGDEKAKQKASNLTSKSILSFLQKKRSFIIPPPPETLESKNDFLEEFHLTCHRKQVQDSIRIDLITTDAIDNESSLPKITTQEDEESPDTSADADDDDQLSVEESSTAKIKIFNLVYRIDDEELRSFARKYGIELGSQIDLGIDPKTGLSSGCATVTLPLGSNVSEVVSKLHGVDCRGRNIRVVDCSRRVKNKFNDSSAANRYFDAAMSFKCNNCGQVGHKQNDCQNPPLPVPCHLCGRPDHDAGTKLFINIFASTSTFNLFLRLSSGL